MWVKVEDACEIRCARTGHGRINEAEAFLTNENASPNSRAARGRQVLLELGEELARPGQHGVGQALDLRVGRSQSLRPSLWLCIHTAATAPLSRGIPPDI